MIRPPRVVRTGRGATTARYSVIVASNTTALLLLLLAPSGATSSNVLPYYHSHSSARARNIVVFLSLGAVLNN